MLAHYYCATSRTQRHSNYGVGGSAAMYELMDRPQVGPGKVDA